MSIDLGFGGLLKGLGNFVELISELEGEEGKTETTRTGELRGKGKFKDLKGVYGVSVRIGPLGGPVLETFGNVKETEEGPRVEEVREPLVDVFDEGDTVRVIAELPGVTAEEVHTEVAGDILTLTSDGDRKYNKELLLPCEVDAASLKTSYRNGILEVVVNKKKVNPATSGAPRSKRKAQGTRVRKAGAEE